MDSIKLYLGCRVRIVSMNGCMAHVRENIREGVIIKFFENKGPGFSGVTREERKYVLIKLDNDNRIARPAVSRLWTMNDNLPEYHE